MKKLLIITVALCAIALAGTTELPVSAQDSRPPAAGDSILSIPACDFNEAEDDDDFTRTSVLFVNSGVGYFRAPVNLPNGSVIKKVILICLDNGGSNINMELYRVQQIGGAQKIATVSSSGSVLGHRIFTQKLTANKYVSTWKYSYYLYLYLPGTDSAGYRFSQAKIVYTPPS